jgi:hypothetical protein
MKMKTRLLLMAAIIAVLGFSASAQKEMLTKEETVNYLSKKLQEIDGRNLITKGGQTRKYSSLSLRIIGDNLELKHTETYGTVTVDYTTYVFNPAHISSIVILGGYQDGSPVRRLRIMFPSKTARHACCGYTTSLSDTDKVDFPYFASLADNRSRIEKALLHLRDLAKAEEEPFGN